MPKIAGLQRRHNTWFLRVRVPADVQEAVQKKEIIKSLKTQDYKEAARRVHVERAKIESEFEEHRQRLKSDNSNRDMLSGYTMYTVPLVYCMCKKTKIKPQKTKDYGG